MKKLISVLLILSAAAAGLAALEVNVTMAAGAKASGGFATWASESDPVLLDPVNGYSPGFAFNVGGVFDMKFGEMLSLETDLMFSGIAGVGFYDGIGDDPWKARIFALEIPILVKFNWKGFFVGAGPDFIIPLGPMVLTAPSGGTTDYSLGFSFGITAALGYELPLGPGRLTMEARYTRPLTPLVDAGFIGGKIYFNRVDFMAATSSASRNRPRRGSMNM